jgi:hypothetical protein
VRDILIIWLIGMIAVVLIFPGVVTGEKMWTPAVYEQMAQEKEHVKFKCDPCDYNIDYGSEYYPTEKVPFEEGFVKFECDPCDYNVDYGGEYLPIDK